MSVKNFKIGDRVRVRKDLEVDCAYGGYLFTNSMERLVDEVNVITGIHNDADAYLLNHRDEGWTDEMLEPAGKTLDNLCAGDFVRSGDSIRKVLAEVDGCYLLSNIADYTTAGYWYTSHDLKDLNYMFVEPDTPEPTIEIDGKMYNKADVEEAIKDLEVVE